MRKRRIRRRSIEIKHEILTPSSSSRIFLFYIRRVGDIHIAVTIE